MKRLGVLVFFDSEGIADEYLIYLLDKIKGSLKDLVIICNGYTREETIKCFNKYSSRVIKRENRGYDGGAYRDCILNHLSKEELDEYDELLLFNDTFFGPFYPFEDVFVEMDSRELDFWGITRHPKFGTEIIRNEHLQSYFLGIRRSILQSRDFYEFWERLGEATNFQEAVDMFEISFTSFFEERGFKWDSYVDSRYLDNKINLGTNYNQNHYKIYELIKEHKHPFIKKKDFSVQSDGAINMQNALKYVDECTDYDVRLIWKTILRKYNLEDLYYCLNLNCIISEKETTSEALEQLENSRLGIIILINSDRYLEKIAKRIELLQQIGICYLFFQNKAIKEKFDDILNVENIDCNRVIRKIGNNLSKKSVVEYMFSISRKSDYICFMHDVEIEEENIPNWVTDENFDFLFDNCLFSKEQVANIIERFSKNQCLGILAPPFITHSVYLCNWRNFWSVDFKLVEEICHMWGSRVDLNQWKYPKFNTDVFWCRGNVAKELFENILTIQKYIDRYLDKRTFEALMQVVIPYMTQGIGYYTENMLSMEYARAQMTIAERRLRLRSDEAWGEHLYFEEQLKIRQEQIDTLSNNKERELQELRTASDNKERKLQELRTAFNNEERELQELRTAFNNMNDFRRIVEGQMKAFVENHEKNYIYGTGIIGLRMYYHLKDMDGVAIDGFVVSKGVQHEEFFEEMPIYSINEINPEEAGIIVALNEKNTKEVIPYLNKNGYKNLYFYSYPRS